MIYIHIPYCHHRCTYCAFYSNAGRRDEHSAYIEAVCEELRQRRHELSGQKPQTLYIGGGTPTLLAPESVEKIASTLRLFFDLSDLKEATIEANPENLTPEYLERLASLGLFNRISIGVQSLDDYDLKLFNRSHIGDQARQAIHHARQAGFANISADLIYGIPGQSVEAWGKNLDQIFHLPITHLSCYALTIEPQTILWRQIECGKLRMPDEDTVIDQYALLLEKATRNGFEQYEISNFSKPGLRSIHNSRYWDRTPYMGIGAAAHSFDGQNRRWNIADTRLYIQAQKSGTVYYETEHLTAAQSFNEYILTALRTTDGIDKHILASFPIDQRQAERQFRPALVQQIQMGRLSETSTHYRPTQKGLLVADSIAVALMLTN